MSVWDRDGLGDLTTLGLQQQQDWLEEDSEKIILCDIQFHDGTSLQTGHFSNYPYIMQQGDTYLDFDGVTLLENIPYEDNLINIPNILSRIDADISIGAIEFLNADGEFDTLITYAWEGHPSRLYIGQKEWIKDDFILILEAVSSVISSPRANIMSLGIRDKKEVFNKKIQADITTGDLAIITQQYVYDLYANNSPAFVEPLDNLITKAVGLEVLLTGGTSYNDIKIAEATANAIAGRPEFTTNWSTGATSFSIDQVLETIAPLEEAHDGADDPADTTYDTEFSFGAQGVTTPFQQTINTSGGVGWSGLNGKYFHLYSSYREFYVWYNVYSSTDSTYNGSVDPEVVDVDSVAFQPELENITVPDTINNTVIPICLGQCFNIEPKLIDSNNHVYQVHEGRVENIIRVRANGVELGAEQYEVNKDIGCFRLLIHQNSTQITCDVIGDNTRPTNAPSAYSVVPYSAPAMVEWIALNKSSLTAADMCVNTFSNFPNNSPLGLYIRDEIDIAPLITNIMASIGGFARFGRTCILQILLLEDPQFKTPVLTLDNDLIIEKGMSLSLTEVPKSSIVLGYDKNWTVQDKGSLAGLITDPTGDFLALLDKYTNEYTSAIANNPNIKLQYPLAEDKDLLGTLITDFVDDLITGLPTTNAQDEVERRRNLRAVKRYVYKIKSTVAPFTVGVGDIVNVVHNRFGFNQGRNCVIIGMDEKPTKQRVDIEVWL